MMRSRFKRALPAALVALSLAGCQVATDPYGRTIMSTHTLGQAMGISGQSARPSIPHTPIVASGPVQEQRVVAGRTVQVVSTEGGHAIVVDGRVLANDADDDRVIIQGVYQGGGRTYVLIAEQSGGTACPSMFQVVDLSSVPVVSPQIGNCSDLPRISVVGGALRVAVPAFRAAPGRTYTFKDGNLGR